MSNSRKNIAETVSELIKPFVEAQGCSLWDVEYVKEGAKQILRITIDREDGVDIDHCEAVHRAIDPVLDEADPIPVQYYLEVSSPGVERELRLPFHFIYAVGQHVDLKFYTAVDGVKKLTGILTRFDSEAETVEVDGKIIPLEKISRANIHFNFDD